MRLDFTSNGLCDAKDPSLTNANDPTKQYGFALKHSESGFTTHHQEILPQASQMDSLGYICHQEIMFGCPEGYAMFQDKCLKVFHSEQTKIDAEMICRRDGASLAKPTTHLEV